MTIQPSDAIAALAVLVTIMLFAINSSGRKRDEAEKAAKKTYEEDLLRRLGAVEGLNATLQAKVHSDELETVKLRGELALVQNNHDASADDIQEIKESMVTKGEWAEAMKSLNAKVDDLRTKSMRPGGSGGYAMTRPQGGGHNPGE